MHTAISKVFERTRRLIVAGSLGLVGLGANATLIVGDPAIDRPNNDSFNNFVIALPSESFTPVGGTINQWRVFVNNPGSVGLLILRGAATAPTVVHSVMGTTVAGLNTFSISPLAVAAGDYLGIWMGTSSKVDFSNSGSGNPYSSNGAYLSLPTPTSVLALGSGSVVREYSINVSLNPVPLPGTLALLGLSLACLAVVRRRSA